MKNSWGANWGINGYFAQTMIDNKGNVSKDPGYIFQYYTYINQEDNSPKISMNLSSKNPKKWALYNYPNEIQGKGENFKANSSGSFVFGQQTQSEFTAIDENFVGALGFVPRIKQKVTGLETGILSQPCKSPGYPSKFNTKLKIYNIKDLCSLLRLIVRYLFL